MPNRATWHITLRHNEPLTVEALTYEIDRTGRFYEFSNGGNSTVASVSIDDIVSIACDEGTPDEAWIIRAEWSNSSPTYHGPFQFVEQAEEWTRRNLSNDPACTSFELAILSPAVTQ